MVTALSFVTLLPVVILLIGPRGFVTSYPLVVANALNYVTIGEGDQVNLVGSRWAAFVESDHLL